AEGGMWQRGAGVAAPQRLAGGRAGAGIYWCHQPPVPPPADAGGVWKRLDAQPPTTVVGLKPDHVRDVAVLVRRYRARAFDPHLFFREDLPETKLESIDPGSQLPGGLVALYDGRGRNQTPRWLPEQRTLPWCSPMR